MTKGRFTTEEKQALTPLFTIYIKGMKAETRKKYLSNYADLISGQILVDLKAEIQEIITFEGEWYELVDAIGFRCLIRELLSKVDYR